MQSPALKNTSDSVKRRNVTHVVRSVNDKREAINIMLNCISVYRTPRGPRTCTLPRMRV